MTDGFIVGVGLQESGGRELGEVELWRKEELKSVEARWNTCASMRGRQVPVKLQRVRGTDDIMRNSKPGYYVLTFYFKDSDFT